MKTTLARFGQVRVAAAVVAAAVTFTILSCPVALAEHYAQSGATERGPGGALVCQPIQYRRS